MPEHPAEILGLKDGDQILSINGLQISNWKEMTREIHSKPDEIINLSWKHNEDILTGSVRTIIAEQFPWNKQIIQGMIGILPMINLGKP